jgi:WD40 repeat protein
LFAGADNVIKVWNTETGEQRRTIGGHSKQVISLKYIGATDNFISCSGDRKVRLYTASNGKNNRDFNGGSGFMYAAACARDQSIVIAGGEDGVLRVWNGKDGKSIATFQPPAPVIEDSAIASTSAAK